MESTSTDFLYKDANVTKTQDSFNNQILKYFSLKCLSYGKFILILGYNLSK